jgi:hypothetical protein
VREVITVEVLTLMALILLVGSIKCIYVFSDITPPFGLRLLLVCEVNTFNVKNQNAPNHRIVETNPMQCSSM